MLSHQRCRSGLAETLPQTKTSLACMINKCIIKTTAVTDQPLAQILDESAVDIYCTACLIWCGAERAQCFLVSSLRIHVQQHLKILMFDFGDLIDKRFSLSLAAASRSSSKIMNFIKKTCLFEMFPPVKILCGHCLG